MNNRILSPILFCLLFLPVCGWAACSGSSPSWECTYDSTVSQIQACIDSATSGDTINITSGSASWASGITINKKLSIIGAGSTSTIITFTGASGVAIDIDADEWRISGIGFVLPLNDVEMINAHGQDWRIDHCKYQSNHIANGADIYGSSRTFISVYSHGSASHATGVIDNNTIINGRIVVHGSSNSVVMNTIYSTSLDLGSEYQIYIENNTFTKPDGQVGKNAVDANYAGRYVVRYNSIDRQYLSAHGVSATEERATKQLEFYGNSTTSTSAAGNFPFYVGGGTGLIFFNVVSDWPYKGPELSIPRAYEGDTSDNTTLAGRCDGTNEYDGNETGKSGYLCRDQVGAGEDVSLLTFGSTPYPVQTKAPLYFWANINGGTHQTATITNSVETWIVSNRDYYDQVASFDGTTGVGCGTLANRPATCTTGVGYWATDQSCSDLTGLVGVAPATPIAGTLYKCTATNTWTAHYTPYTYPHPLRNEAATTYAATITSAGSGTGTVTSSPEGVSCGDTCEYSFNSGQEVILTATATLPNYFVGWSGTGGCTGTSTCVLTMSAAKAATATFSRYGTATIGSGGSMTIGSGGSLTLQ